MNYKGSCHCGAVAYQVDGEIKSAMECNCSLCQRKGALLWFVPRDSLNLLTPENASRTYKFNKEVIQHRFCPTCGIHPYAEGTDAKGERMAAVNVRCLEGVDLASIPVTHMNGRAR